MTTSEVPEAQRLRPRGHLLRLDVHARRTARRAAVGGRYVSAGSALGESGLASRAGSGAPTARSRASLRQAGLPRGRADDDVGGARGAAVCRPRRHRVGVDSCSAPAAAPSAAAAPPPAPARTDAASALTAPAKGSPDVGDVRPLGNGGASKAERRRSPNAGRAIRTPTPRFVRRAAGAPEEEIDRQLGLLRSRGSARRSPTARAAGGRPTSGPRRRSTRRRRRRRARRLSLRRPSSTRSRSRGRRAAPFDGGGPQPPAWYAIASPTSSARARRTARRRRGERPRSRRRAAALTALGGRVRGGGRRGRGVTVPRATAAPPAAGGAAVDRAGRGGRCSASTCTTRCPGSDPLHHSPFAFHHALLTTHHPPRTTHHAPFAAAASRGGRAPPRANGQRRERGLHRVAGLRPALLLQERRRRARAAADFGSTARRRRRRRASCGTSTAGCSSPSTASASACARACSRSYAPSYARTRSGAHKLHLRRRARHRRADARALPPRRPAGGLRRRLRRLGAIPRPPGGDGARASAVRRLEDGEAQGDQVAKEAAAAFAEPPAYAKQKERALQFIYDDEVRCGSL